ncbi:MAG: HRDC domain-containing protein [Planctomycetia bacterium]|nr:HRDC domain-containing protein [Planctomycetia bacterium]
MQFKIFQIPASGSDEIEDEMNQFLRSHRIVSTRSELVNDDHHSFWCFCIEYIDGKLIEKSDRREPPKDYKEELSEKEFSVFVHLRDLRKQIAEQEAVAAFILWTNKQMCEMVKNRCITKADLKKIDRFGESKVEKYGDRILEILKSAFEVENEASRTVDGTDSGTRQPSFSVD